MIWLKRFDLCRNNNKIWQQQREQKKIVKKNRKRFQIVRAKHTHRTATHTYTNEIDLFSFGAHVLLSLGLLDAVGVQSTTEPRSKTTVFSKRTNIIPATQRIANKFKTTQKHTHTHIQHHRYLQLVHVSPSVAVAHIIYICVCIRNGKANDVPNKSTNYSNFFCTKKAKHREEKKLIVTRIESHIHCIGTTYTAQCVCVYIVPIQILVYITQSRAQLGTDINGKHFPFI